MAANSSSSQLDRRTLFRFLVQHLRTPPSRVTTPPLIDLREVSSEAQSASVRHKSSSDWGSWEGKPCQARRFPQVSSNSLRRSHVSNARRRGSTCQIVRKIVELCCDSLTQAFLFFIERLGLVILAWATPSPWSETRLAPTCSVPARRQPPCHVSNLLQRPTHPSQRMIENAEFLLIIKLGPCHLITGLTSFLECRSPFSLCPDEDQRQKCLAMHS